VGVGVAGGGDDSVTAGAATPEAIAASTLFTFNVLRYTMTP